MRAAFTFSFLLFPFTLLFAQANNTHFLLFGDTSCRMTAAPSVLFNGEQVKINCDTAYLINKYRYSLYERAKAMLLHMDGSTQKKMIDEYELAAKAADANYFALLGKYKSLSDTCLNATRESQGMLERSKQELESARMSLTRAMANLEDARQIILNNKRRNMRSKILWGVGGLGAGLLTGLVLFH